MKFCYKSESKDLDPSYKTDLGVWECRIAEEIQ